MWQKRSGYDDDPLAFVIDLVQRSETSAVRLVRKYISEDMNSLRETMLSTIRDLRSSDTTRRVTYNSINFEMTVSDRYTKPHTINEI